jgi:hypothetical protein
VAVNDEGDDEGADDGDHEELGRNEVVRQFPDKDKNRPIALWMGELYFFYFFTTIYTI